MHIILDKLCINQKLLFFLNFLFFIRTKLLDKPLPLQSVVQLSVGSAALTFNF